MRSLFQLQPLNHNLAIRSFVPLIAMISLLISFSARAQQSFTYTQYMDNLTPLNPAYPILDKTGSLNVVARQQWAGIEGAPTSFLFNLNLPIASMAAASGLIVTNDQFAVEHQTAVNAFFAKSVRVGSNNYLAVALNAGIRSYVANYSTLDNTDPQFRDDVRETRPNIGFGVMYYTDKYYLGISVPQLTIRTLGNGSTTDNNSFRNYYFFSGAMITNLSSDMKLKPATLLSYSRGAPLIADISGTLYFKDMLGMGVNYRTNSEVAGILSFNFNSFRLGYSYQFGTLSSNIGGFSNATHEITLSYRLGKTTTAKLL